MQRKTLLAIALTLSALIWTPGQTAEPLKALIVDGQNNHAVWPTTTLDHEGGLAVDHCNVHEKSEWS